MTLFKKVVVGCLIVIVIASGVCTFLCPPLATITGAGITALLGLFAHEKHTNKNRVENEIKNKKSPQPVAIPEIPSVIIKSGTHLHFSYHQTHTKSPEGVITDTVDVELSENNSRNTPKNKLK